MRTERLEEAVWNTVREVLEHPDVVLAELRRIKDTEQAPIGEEIVRVEREIRRCKDQERRLVKLYQFGEVDDKWIKAQSGPIKLTRERHEAELERLRAQTETLRELDGKEDQLRDFCLRVRSNLDTFDIEEQRMALQALQIKATVTETEVRVKGILGIADVQPDLATTARTSG